MIIKKKVPVLYLFNKIKFDLLWVIFINIVVSIFLSLFSDKIPEMPLNIPAFLGTAISVLLSFKMAQSYDRWWEARQIWGAIVNDSRTLVLQLQGFCQEGNLDKIKTITLRQIAWCNTLVNRLRETSNHDKGSQNISAEEWESTSKKSHIPLAISQNQISDLKQLRENKIIDGFAHTQIDATITRLVESMGKAERIKNTVFPTTYRYVLHASIFVFVIVLDISLKHVNFIFQLPLILVISSIFFLLEKSSTNLQNPFNNDPTDTPITAICEAIEGNLKELIGEPYEKPKVNKKLFYQM